MNSYTPAETLYTKKAYRLNLEKQNKCLDVMYELIYSMRCNGKNTLQAFQKGILISIKSIKLLYEDLKQKYNINYILTHRLNQDSFESYFSTIRSRGGLHDHPTPSNAMYRIRIIVLGKNAGVIQDKVNIEVKHNNTNVEEYLVANVVSTADIKVNGYENDDELSDSSLSSYESSQNNCETPSEEDGFKQIFVVGSLGNSKTNIPI